MKLEIEKLNLEITYKDLQLGDVFSFGTNNKNAVGLKTDKGYVLIKSAYDEPAFHQITSPLSDNVSVIYHGQLIKMGVK